MSLPTLADQTSAVLFSGGGNRDLALSFPTPVAAGDLLIIYTRIGNASIMDLPTGFTWLVNNVSSVDDDLMTISYKFATGGETGHTLHWDANAVHTNDFGAICHRITGHNGTAPQISTIAQANSTTPDVNSLTPSGNGQYLWIQHVSSTSGANMTPDDTTPGTTDGDSFTNYLYAENGWNCGLITWTLQKADNSLDPVAWNMPGNRRWDGWLLAVEGLPPPRINIRAR